MNDIQRINKLGGVAEVARLCGLHISSVSKWKVRGIPEGWRRYLNALQQSNAAKRNGG
jgi:hypothetical protein